jgi:hypothetical protein
MSPNHFGTSILQDICCDLSRSDETLSFSIVHFTQFPETDTEL